MPWFKIKEFYIVSRDVLKTKTGSKLKNRPGLIKQGIMVFGKLCPIFKFRYKNNEFFIT